MELLPGLNTGQLRFILVANSLLVQ